MLIWGSMLQGQAGGQSTAAHLLSNLAAWPAMQSALLARQGLVVLLAGIIGGKQAVLDPRIPAAAARLVANLAHTDAGARRLYDEVSACTNSLLPCQAGSALPAYACAASSWPLLCHAWAALKSIKYGPCEQELL